MPACDATDAHVAVWDAQEAGDEATARHLFSQLLPLLNMEAIYSSTIYKEVLYRRGVIAPRKTRAPGSAILDEEASRELDLILAELSQLVSADTGSPPRVG